MDIATVTQVANSVASGLAALGTLAPSVAAAFTGGQSVEDATKAALDAAKALPVLEDEGEWDKDLAARKKRG